MKSSASGVGAVSVDEPSDLRARADGGFGSKRVGRGWNVAEAWQISVVEKGQNRGVGMRVAMVIMGKMILMSAQGDLCKCMF